MKKFIRNLENSYIALAILIFGILLVIMPTQFVHVLPWLMGFALILRGISVIVLIFHFKDKTFGPGAVIYNFVMGITIIVIGGDSINIIGVIWAVYSLIEACKEISEMWREKKYPVIKLINSVISIALAVMLITNPFEHFTTHVVILGIEIISSCFARSFDIMKSRLAQRRAY